MLIENVLKHIKNRNSTHQGFNYFHLINTFVSMLTVDLQHDTQLTLFVCLLSSPLNIWLKFFSFLQNNVMIL